MGNTLAANGFSAHSKRLIWPCASRNTRGRDSEIKPRFVVLLPVTHAPPIRDTVAIEIPANVRRSIGLDDEPGWLVVSEYHG
jgi:hypothetical protein